MFFSTPFTSFTSCFFDRSVSFILFSLKTLSLQTWIITISSRWQSFSSTGIVALQVGYDLQNTKNYYSTANSPIIIVRVAHYLLMRLHIYLPTWSSRAKCLTVCPRYFTQRLDTRICACALPSPSPFHYVMAQLFPVVQLAAHAKSSTMYGRSSGRTVVSPSFFGLKVTTVIMYNYGATLQALQAPLLLFPLYFPQDGNHN